MNNIIAVDHNKKTTSPNYRGSNSFATFMIIGPTCFFLGILFAQFPYDFPLLWTTDAIPPTFLAQLETHLKFLFGAPPLISRVLHIMVGTGFLGFFVKLFRPSEANMLFDGAGLVLYVIGVGIYITNIIKGLRAVDAGIWDADGNPLPIPGAQEAATHNVGTAGAEVVLGREDSLKVLAASNTILALVLVGVLVLMAGQWYAERKDREEAEKLDREETTPTTHGKKDRRPSSSGGAAGGAANKKKQ